MLVKCVHLSVGGKQKDRGQLEVKIAFNVKSGSLTNLSKKEKHRSSLSHVAQSVGGSLLSLGSAEKRKGIKKFAKSIGSKMHLKGKKKDEFDDGASSIGSVGSLNIRSQTLNRNYKSRQTLEDADPGVVSDEDEFTVSKSQNCKISPRKTITQNVPLIKFNFERFHKVAVYLNDRHICKFSLLTS